MGEDSRTRRAAAICEQCGTAHSVKIDGDGEVFPLGTGAGPKCSCGESQFQILSDDEDILKDIEAETSEAN